jgi:hypothetical protein
MKGRTLFVGALLLAVSAMPSVARGQSVRGTVMGSGTTPVAGVMVVLVDSASATVASSLSDERGAFFVRATKAGTYRLRTLRIGFRATITPSFALAAGQDITRRLDVEEIRFRLDTVRVTGRNACRQATDSAVATFAVWEQVRTVLTAVQLTAQEREITSTIIAYERRLDRTSRRVQEQTGTLNTALVTEPWHSRAPGMLREAGYVENSGADGATFYAPGIDVLLSKEFVEDHCFRLARSENVSLLGISFEPNPERKKVAEIKGVMWLDRATSELRTVDFGYVNPPRARLDEGVGGMTFVRLKDGRWAISQWNIRMPVLLVGYSSGDEARVAEYRVAGGELSLVLRGGDTLFKRPPVVLGGVLTDSLTGAAVAQARIALAGTTLNTTSDLTGRFVIGDVLPGDYTIEVRTASLDSVTAVSQTAVSITGSITDLRLRIPTGQQIAGSLCGSARLEAPGIVLGTVSLRGDTLIPAGVKITAEWQQPFIKVEGGNTVMGKRSKWAEARADDRGRYRVCGVPVNFKFTMRAESDSASAVDTVTIPAGGRMARANLALDRAVTRGGVFAGTVVADSASVPLPDAEITLPSINRRSMTNEKGAFRMADIPIGKHQVEVRRRGYTLASAEIEFAPNQTQHRKIVMQPGVLEEPPPALNERNLIASFEENRRAGRGYFLTREELAKTGTRRMSDVVARIPGANVMRGRSNAGFPGAKASGARQGGNVGRSPAGGGGGPPGAANQEGRNTPRSDAAAGIYCPDDVESRSGIECGCYSQVFVNNMLMNRGSPTPPFDVNTVATEQLDALEYYRSAAETPPKYSGSATQCGILVLWTKRSP